MREATHVYACGDGVALTLFEGRTRTQSPFVFVWLGRGGEGGSGPHILVHVAEGSSGVQHSLLQCFFVCSFIYSFILCYLSISQIMMILQIVYWKLYFVCKNIGYQINFARYNAYDVTSLNTYIWLALQIEQITIFDHCSKRNSLNTEKMAASLKISLRNSGPVFVSCSG